MSDLSPTRLRNGFKLIYEREIGNERGADHRYAVALLTEDPTREEMAAIMQQLKEKVDADFAARKPFAGIAAR